MFIGEYYYNLDAKGRMAIPSKSQSGWRDLNYYSRLDSCLFLYEKDWEQLAEKIKNLPLSQANSGFCSFDVSGSNGSYH